MLSPVAGKFSVDSGKKSLPGVFPDYRRAQVFKRLAQRLFPAINVD